MRAVALVIALVACAPAVDGPAERARAADAEDSAALARVLAALRGVTSAHAIVHRVPPDPFASVAQGSANLTPPRGTPSAAVLVIVDDHADVAATEATARRLVRAAIPEVATPEIVVAVGAHRADLARVGPFTVDARSKRTLQVVLVSILAIVAALAGFIAWRARPGTRD